MKSNSRVTRGDVLTAMKSCIRILVSFAWVFLFSTFIKAAAQPSGGPYGPIRQTYSLPKAVAAVYYVAVDGQADRPGCSLDQPTTLESAMERANSGDAIILRGGTYRTGHLMLNQGILLQPFRDERPVLKGTMVAANWTNLGNGLWTTSWSHLFPSKPAGWWQRNREGKKTPLHRFNNDMVFIDGVLLQSAGWEGEVDGNSFYIDYDAGLVYIGVDPADHLVEITAYDAALMRTVFEVHGKKPDHRGPIIRGISFTQYAYRALEVEGTEPEGISPESGHGKQVVGTTLEDCTISFCSRVAGYLRGDSLTIRRCRISDTSTEGIYIIASNDVLLERNIFTRNNMEHITGYYPAAVKIFNQCHRVTCRDNLVIDLPYSNGIWYDVGNVDGVFINNWIEGVGRTDTIPRTDQVWPSDNGFFFEISKGAICAGNVFVNCDHGVMVLNSSNVSVCQNTFINSTACFGRNARVAAGDHFGWHASAGPDVDRRDGHIFINNLLAGDEAYRRPLLFVWQPASLCEKLPRPLLQQLDYNVYVRGSASGSYPMILWSPVANEQCQAGIDSLAELQKFTGFPMHSRVLQPAAFFKSPELGDYKILPGFPGADCATSTPAPVRKALGCVQAEKPYVGAYPAERAK